MPKKYKSVNGTRLRNENLWAMNAHKIKISRNTAPHVLSGWFQLKMAKILIFQIIGIFFKGLFFKFIYRFPKKFCVLTFFLWFNAHRFLLCERLPLTDFFFVSVHRSQIFILWAFTAHRFLFCERAPLTDFHFVSVYRS